MSHPKIKYSDLIDFLKRNKTLPENDFTHTSIGCPEDNIYAGSYCIKDEDKKLFHHLYNKWVFDDNNKAYLTERHLEVSPILIDLDFRHNMAKCSTRQYTQEFIIKFLEIFIDKLMDSVSDIDTNKVSAFVLEKDKPNLRGGNGVFKDGIHIIFPYLVTEPKLQYILRYKMLEDSRVINLFNSINVKNSPDDIYDIAVIERNNWQMFGSRKPNNLCYKLTYIYKLNNSLMKEVINKYTNHELTKILSIRNIKEDNKINSKSYYPKFNDDYENIPKPQKDKKKKKITNKKHKSPIKKNFLEDRDELVFVKNIIKILDDKRADNYDLWIRLGWCLHNIDNSLLEDWINLSKRSYKYVEGECEKEWMTMDNDGLGLGTLYFWARQDNLKSFKELTRKNIRKCMLSTLTLQPNDIAKVIHCLYKGDFVCGSAKKNIWYQFINHRWNEIDDGINLSKKFSSEVVDEYDKLDKFLSDQIEKSKDEDDKDLKRKKKDTISKIIKKLKTTSFKKNIITECKEFFHDSEFEKKLDMNPNLLGFENGIFDLEQFKFRNGLPEDYISFSTKINYIEHDEDDEDIINVKEFMKQVLPKKLVREYVYKTLASVLSGKNINERFHIWTGCGGNGKSKLIELFEGCIGDYSCKLPVKIVTESRARSEAANPALSNAKGKRFTCLQEPDKYDEINVGQMKELTGGDLITTRGLYSNQMQFKPQFKMVMTCNDLPKVSANDRGTWRRISVVEFISKFVDHPNHNEPYEFLVDEDLDQKLKVWPEAFVYVLLGYYKKYGRKRIEEPQEVKRFTEQYQEESDVFTGFINEYIVESVNPNNQGETLEKIYSKFTEWHKGHYGTTKCASRKELKEALVKKFGSKSKNSKNKFMGIELKEYVMIGDN